MKGEDDHQMVEIVRAITDKYIAHANDVAKTDRNKKIEIIDRRVKQTESDLVQRRQDYVNLSLQIGAVDSKEIEKRRNLIESEIHRLNSKLSSLETEKLKAEQEVVRLTERQRAIDDGEYPPELLLEGIEESPRMIKLEERMSEISELLQEQRAAAKDPQRDPSVHRTLRTLQNLKEEEEQLKTEFMRKAMARLKWGGNDRLEDSLPAAKIRAEFQRRLLSIGVEGWVVEEVLRELGAAPQSAEVDDLSDPRGPSRVAMTFASCSPLSTLDRGGCSRACPLRVLSNPNVTSRSRMFSTVFVRQPTASAILASVHAGPSASAFNRT
jgi:hypothetical protein